MLHGSPIAAETRSAFADPAVYTGKDCTEMPVTLAQWANGVTLGGRVYVHGLPPPNKSYQLGSESIR